MGNLKIILSVLLCLVLDGCRKYDLDLTGHLYPDEPIDARFRTCMDWNASHPDKRVKVKADGYHVFFAGDSHLGATKNLKTMFDSAAVSGASAVFLVGDLTSGKEEDYLTLENFLSRDSLSTWFATVGNHDLLFKGWDRYFNLLGSSLYTLVIEGPDFEDLVLVLDSGNGTLGSDQISWLESILVSERKSYRKCIVMTHQNFFRHRFTTSSNPLVEELSYMLDLFERTDVDLCVMAHEHTRDEKRLGATDYITLDALQDINAAASWLRVEVSDTISWRFVEI